MTESIIGEAERAYVMNDGDLGLIRGNMSLDIWCNRIPTDMVCMNHWFTKQLMQGGDIWNRRLRRWGKVMVTCIKRLQRFRFRENWQCPDIWVSPCCRPYVARSAEP